MADFFEHLDIDSATAIDQLSQLLYELRENRHAVLRQFDAADESALLLQIEAGTLDEHPAYEHYLAARILGDTREAVRELLGNRLKESGRT